MDGKKCAGRLFTGWIVVTPKSNAVSNASIHRLKDEDVFVGTDVRSKDATAENFAAEFGAVFELKQEPRRLGWRFDGWLWLPKC